MEANSMLAYIQSHGYIVLFLSVFFGIVGIPAPEESLLFLVGMLISHEQLHFMKSLLFATVGATVGMVVAYVAGYTFGSPFLFKYGHYIGVNRRRFRYAYRQFRKHGKLFILFGYYIPGARQISPYMAGVVRFPFPLFLLLSFFGALIWIIFFLCLGKFLGEKLHIPLHVIPFIALFFLVLFIGGMFVNKKRKNT
jgi:membrane-associated protein